MEPSTEQVLELIKNYRGAKDGLIFYSKTGRNLVVGTTAETVWEVGGNPYEISTAEALYVSSSSGSDTTPKAVTVTGLNSAGAIQEVTEVLVGTTKTEILGGAGTGTVLWTAVNNVEISAGAQEVGDVYIYPDVAETAGVPDVLTNVIAKILAGEGKAGGAYITVPAGYVGAILGHEIELSAAGYGGLQVKESGEVWKSQGTLWTATPTHPVLVGAQGQVRSQATAASGTLVAAGGFEIYLLDTESVPGFGGKF